MKFYFLLQYRMLKREIQAYGLNPYVGLLLYLLCFIAISILMFKKVAYANILYSALAIGFIYLLGDEIRNQGLKIIFNRVWYQKIRLMENLICAIPFACFLAVRNQYGSAASVLLAALLLSFYNTVNRPRFVLFSPFSRKPYEFSVGFRNSWLLLAALFALILISIRYHNLNQGLLSHLGLFLVCLSFYSHLDPVYYVWIHAQAPARFLKMKIRTGLEYAFWLSLAGAALLSIFNPAELLTITGVEVLGLFYMVAGILAVYVNYPMPMTLSQRFQFYISLFLFPLLLFVIPNFYVQANERLKQYLK